MKEGADLSPVSKSGTILINVHDNLVIKACREYVCPKQKQLM